MNDYFQQQLAETQQQYTLAKNQSDNFSMLRGILFVIAITSLIAFFSSYQHQAWWWLLVAGISGSAFYRVVLIHLQWEEKTTFLNQLIILYQEELQRLDLNLTQLPDGNHFIQKDHPYHLDLDIFGKHSLFQLLNRCQIPESQELMAGWLSKKATPQEILSRQEAIKELARTPEWCHQLQVRTRIELNKKKKNIPDVPQKALTDWIQQPLTFQLTRFWKPVTILFLLISLVLIGIVVMGVIPYQLLYLLLFTNGIWLMISARRLHELAKGINNSLYLITAFEQTINEIEQRPFGSEKLKALANRLTTSNGHKASHEIKALKKITHRLAARANMLYLILDGPLLLDAFLLTALFEWKQKNKDHLQTWLRVINEIECLTSLAGFAFAHPEYNFPVITETPFNFESKALGHPLIPPAERVTNDYQLCGLGNIDIITGSNMSGKSTFERTIGINMVLAQTGAPVNAGTLHMGSTEVFASMRTTDDLAQHTSSFYAELKRIQQLLNFCDQHSSTFFVLDELLKGTNSDDRHKGAVALIQQLSKKPVFGLISTHDLALGKEMTSHTNIRNFSFNSEITNGNIVFDYQLTPGLCKSFNASELMLQMGIIEK